MGEKSLNVRDDEIKALNQWFSGRALGHVIFGSRVRSPLESLNIFRWALCFVCQTSYMKSKNYNVFHVHEILSCKNVKV